MMKQKIYTIAISAILIIMAISIWVYWQSHQFTRQQSPHIQTFLERYGKTWDPQSVHNLVSNSFYIFLKTEHGQSVQKVLTELGAFRKIIHIKLDHYQKIDNETELGIFLIETQLIHSKAILRITLRCKDNQSWIDNLSVRAVENQRPRPSLGNKF